MEHTLRIHIRLIIATTRLGAFVYSGDIAPMTVTLIKKVT